MKPFPVTLADASRVGRRAGPPARANTGLLPPPGSRLVGQNQFHVVQDDGGSLEAIAKKYNVGFPLQANQG